MSLALGAFFAGMVLSESQLSQQAATESLPLRDAFAVLFFVSVGMLFHPAIMVDAPLAVLATVVIIVAAKSMVAYAVVRAFGQSHDTGLMISVSLAQIGEFSFILANLGMRLNVLPSEGRDLILAGAIISILLNPILFSALDRYFARRDKTSGDTASVPEPLEESEAQADEATPIREHIPVTSLTDHIVLIGHGRVGRFVSKALRESNTPLYIIEDDADDTAELKAQGVEVLHGNAADPEVIKSANLPRRAAYSSRFRRIRRRSSGRAGPRDQLDLRIVARAHSEAEIDHLATHGGLCGHGRARDRQGHARRAQ